MTNKLPGRQGDTPVIGSGSYANNKTCAVSGTGRGEDFLRSVAAYDIHARIFLGKKTLEEAVKETVFETLPAEAGGFIAIDKDGNTSMTFNSKGMFRGMCNSEGHGSYGVWEYESPFTISKI